MVLKHKKVIIIGGGMGGLSAAISLAQNGYQVALYEKNDHIGGKLNRLEQDGFGFDLGPSILTMPHIFQKLFTGSGKRMEDYVQITRLDLEWRSFFPDGAVLDLYRDLHKMLTENPALSTEDIEEYKGFLAYAKKLNDLAEAGYFAEGLDTTLDVLRYHGIWGSIKGFDLFSTMQEAISRRISNPHLAKMLSYFIKYVGSSPYEAPAVLNLLIYMQHAQGLWYVSGGMHKLAEGLTRLAKEIGVDIHTGAAVDKLLKDGKRIKGAKLADGTTLEADYVVSNMEVQPAYKYLLNEDERFLSKLNKKFEPACSGLVLHLGVSKQYPQLSHHNFFFSEDLHEQMDQIFNKHQLPEDPTIYLVNVNKTDPAQSRPGYENLKVLPHIPYIREDPFTAEDYQAFEDRVIDKLERMGLEDLRANIVTKDVWTPHDIERTYWSDRGAIYGTVSDKKKNRGFKHPKQSSLYDNLYFVGGTVNPGGGLPMVTLSGQQVCDLIVKRDS